MHDAIFVFPVEKSMVVLYTIFSNNLKRWIIWLDSIGIICII